MTKPWIRLAPNKRYFMFEDGTPFFPIGTALNGACIAYDATEAQFVDYLKSMQAHGENFLRIDLEGFSWNDTKEEVARKVKRGQIPFLENPPGTFHEAYARRVDTLIALAEQYGVYLELVIPSHTCTLEENFASYPYFKGNGGPVQTVQLLRTDEAAKALWKKRMEYVVDRWGKSPQVFMWEIWNEIDVPTCGCGNGSESAAWAEEMGCYLRDYETARYGKAHLIGLSAGDFYITSPDYQFFYTTRGTDVLQSHYYTKSRNMLNPVREALDIKATVANHVQLAGYRKPYLENERQMLVDNPKVMAGDLQELMMGTVKDVEHHALWAYLASGAAGAGATWAPRIERVPSSVAESAATMRPFLALFDLAQVDSRPFADQISLSHPQVITLAVGDGQTVIGWLLHDTSLDYDIELVNAGRKTASLSDPKSKDLRKLQMLSKWKLLLDQAGVETRWDDGLRKLSGVLQANLGMDQAAADRAVDKLLAEPQRFVAQAMATRMKDAPPGTARKLGAALMQVADSAWQHFESIETNQQALEHLYKGHPPVETTVTVSGLVDAPHTWIWYNDDDGNVISQQEVAGPTVSATSPTFRKHVAFVIRPAR
ncbi:MAG: DUF4038 domain-containing protein [Lentisphaerae bacterium]|nr:DUF4038 domain-containing protein [Lentisphaerota bacterium]